MADTTQRVFVSYIDRSREYYLARGYGNPYRWASFADVPFAPLAKPLADCRMGVVTTAALDGDTARLRRVYAAPADPPPTSLFTHHVAWDKEATHTRDVESFLPLRRLQELVAAGTIGAVAERFYGVPTDFSQRRTLEEYAPETLGMCREDAVDAALLVAL